MSEGATGGTAAVAGGTRVLAPGGDLLDAYDDPDGFFFSRRGEGLAAAGATRRVVLAPGPDPVRRAAAAASEALVEAAGAGLPDPVVVGALAFGPATASVLTVPRLLVRQPSPAVAVPVAPPPPRARGRLRARFGAGTAERVLRLRPAPPPEVFADRVRAAVARIEAGELEKVVLSRTLEVERAVPFSARSVLASLRAADPGCFTFGVVLAGAGPGSRHLLGASPELLVRREGREVRSAALAGTAPRSPSPAADEQAARRLLASAKDRREHALVVEAVVAALTPFCETVSVPPEPSVMSTASLWHLSSDVSGLLREPAVDALTLAAAVHPSPAVCGTPAGAALQLIAELEDFDRGLYTGLVGWVDSRGDGEWAVVLRCAEVEGTRARLFAGAGIVAGSDPDAEAVETQAKFVAMLTALRRS